MVTKKLHGFLWSLFSVTGERLKVISQFQGTAHVLPNLTEEGVRKLSDNDNERNKLVQRLIARQEILAAAFRDCMTQGQSGEASNGYREKSFQDVVNAVDNVSF
jgi:hypothetical protein